MRPADVMKWRRTYAVEDAVRSEGEAWGARHYAGFLERWVPVAQGVPDNQREQLTQMLLEVLVAIPRT